MIRYIEAFSTEHESVYTPQAGETSLFLAGGISNCPDWQTYMARLLHYNDYVVLNPRRNDFPMDDPSAAEAQIKWEYQHLKLASIVIFWFPCETLCPITLFEYGKLLVSNKPLFVGCHPNYARKLDLEIQTKLERPYLKVYNSLDDMFEQIQNQQYLWKAQ